MNYYSAQFILEGFFKLERIIGYPVDADEYVAFYGRARLGVVKRDNVREVVMVEVVDIDLMQIVVGTKNIGNFLYCPAFLCGCLNDPIRDLSFIAELKIYIL